MLCLKPAIQYTVFEQLRKALLALLSRRANTQVKALTAVQVRRDEEGSCDGSIAGAGGQRRQGRAPPFVRSFSPAPPPNAYLSTAQPHHDQSPLSSLSPPPAIPPHPQPSFCHSTNPPSIPSNTQAFLLGAFSRAVATVLLFPWIRVRKQIMAAAAPPGPPATATAVRSVRMHTSLQRANLL